MGNKAAVMAACLCLVASVALAQDAANTRTFDDIKCKLTLPLGGQWLDQSQLPKEVRAFFEVPSGLRALLLAQRLPGIELNAEAIKGLEDGMTGDGQAELLETEKMAFRSVPAHQMRGRLRLQGAMFVTRAFCANDCMYQLQVLGTPDLFDDEKAVESVFAAFEFIGEPKLKSSAPSASSTLASPTERPERSTYQKALGFSALMGRLVGIIIIAIVVILIVRFIVYLARRKKESADESGQQE